MAVSAERLSVEPGRSRLMEQFVITVHLVPFALVLAFDLPGIFQAVATAVLLISASVSWKKQISNRDWKRVELNGDNQWTLYGRSGHGVSARLLPSTLVLPQLIIFHFSVSGFRRHHILVPQDSASREMLRKLRIRLRETDQSAEPPRA